MQEIFALYPEIACVIAELAGFGHWVLDRIISPRAVHVPPLSGGDFYSVFSCPLNAELDHSLGFILGNYTWIISFLYPYKIGDLLGISVWVIFSCQLTVSQRP